MAASPSNPPTIPTPVLIRACEADIGVVNAALAGDPCLADLPAALSARRSLVLARANLRLALEQLTKRRETDPQTDC